MGSIILPNTFSETHGRPVIFLAGPIRCAPKWHAEAIAYLLEKSPDILIAAPVRQIPDTFNKQILEGVPNHFHRQRAWEHHYLDLAAKHGCVLFWLPGPAEANPNKVYGAMTRVELGQWITKIKHDPASRVVFGSDGKFPEISTVMYDMSLDAPRHRLHATLKDTCDAALRVASTQGTPKPELV